MGGSVKILVRFSNDEKMAFSICTSQLKEFENTLFLDEENFKSHLMNKYHKCEPLFAPYGYGALFFDLQEKKIFSCNGYSGYMNYVCINLFGKLTQLIHSAKEKNEHLYDQEDISQEFTYDSSDIDILDQVKIFNAPSNSYSEFYMINHALKNNWLVKINNKPLNHDNDFIQLMNSILNKDIIKDTEHSLDGFSWAVKDELSSEHIDYIEIVPNGWKFIQDDNSLDSLNDLFTYMKANGILDNSEISHWELFLNDLK